MHILPDLFLSFAKIGLFTFGGGYAMIPLIESVCVDKKHWLTQEELLNMTVLAESTPGPIAINCATYAGYRTAGFWGALAATVGVIVPSFVVLYLISMFLEDFLALTVVANAFRGIKIAVGVLIFNAALRMLKKQRRDWLSVVILIASAVAILCSNIFSWGLSSIRLMLAAAAVSLTAFALGLAAKRRRGQ